MAVFFYPFQMQSGEKMPRTDDLRIREMKELTPPSHLIREFGGSEKVENTTAECRTALHRILHGQDDRVMVVIGPCSIHDTKAAMEYAPRASCCSTSTSWACRPAPSSST